MQSDHEKYLGPGRQAMSENKQQMADGNPDQEACGKKYFCSGAYPAFDLGLCVYALFKIYLPSQKY